MSNGNVVILKNNVKAVRGAISGENLKAAVEAGGRVIEGAAKVNIRNTFSSMMGALENSILVVINKATATEAEAEIGPTAIYGRIQELGGIITPVKAKLLSWVNDAGERIFAHMVHLPPRPYMRPAVDENLNAIEQAMSYQLKKSITGAIE